MLKSPLLASPVARLRDIAQPEVPLMSKSAVGQKLKRRGRLKTAISVGSMVICGFLLMKTAGTFSVSDGRFAAIRAPPVEDVVGFGEKTGSLKQRHGDEGPVQPGDSSIEVPEAIVGGTNATFGSNPWIAALFHKSRLNHGPYCGGSLIDKRWVLTARHCVTRLAERDILVRMGEHNWRDNTDPKPHGDYNVEEFFPHGQRPQVEDDIALIKLKEKVKLSKKVKHIKKIGLAGGKGNYLGRTAKNAGWGVANLTTKYKPSVLKELHVRVVKETEHHIFTVAGKAADTCLYDSGGPLTLKEGGTDILIGVLVSGDPSCDSSKSPAKHMRVSQYLKWIISTISINSQSAG